MKKAYESPMIEKIQFNYRDQVVAASGAAGDTGVSAGNNSQEITWEGGIGCKIADVVLRGALDFVSCYSA